MSVTRNELILIVTVTLLYLIGQLLTGTDPVVASLFSIAIFFGALSVFAGGGLASAFGCLNAILIGKFLLFGIAVKIALCQPSDDSLSAPPTTALVMALGFIGLFVGTLIQHRLPCPRFLSMNRPLGDRLLRSLSIVLFITGYAAYFASMIPDISGQGLQTGGWLGIARTLGSLRSLSIIPSMLYLWQIRTRLWMMHPVVISLLAWGTLVGIFSTGKLEAMEPLVFYVLLGFLRYGWRDLRLWSLVSLGTIYYAMILFPYSQYVRGNGGRQGTFAQRAEVTKYTFLRVATDQNFRTTLSNREDKGSYFGSGQLSPFGRLAMVGEADRLIAATERQEAFTGWETIIWGPKLLAPSFLYSEKPVVEAGNYLGHIAGEVASSDTTTQMSYGIMANLYSAFSFVGVLIGTPIFVAGFYYWIRIFCGNAKWEGQPTTSTLWFIWIIASYQHSIVEGSLSGIVASLSFPVVFGLLYVLSRGLSLFFPNKVCQA
jgi:hypothetical protein